MGRELRVICLRAIDAKLRGESVVEGDQRR
jgi:hypothetical protein